MALTIGALIVVFIRLHTENALV